MSMVAGMVVAPRHDACQVYNLVQGRKSGCSAPQAGTAILWFGRAINKARSCWGGTDGFFRNGKSRNSKSWC
jgi:hypothetical protein